MKSFLIGFTRSSFDPRVFRNSSGDCISVDPSTTVELAFSNSSRYKEAISASDIPPITKTINFFAFFLPYSSASRESKSSSFSTISVIFGIIRGIYTLPLYLSNCYMYFDLVLSGRLSQVGLRLSSFAAVVG